MFLPVEEQCVLHKRSHRNRIGFRAGAADQVHDEARQSSIGKWLTGTVVNLDAETLQFGGNPARQFPVGRDQRGAVRRIFDGFSQRKGDCQRFLAFIGCFQNDYSAEGFPQCIFVVLRTAFGPG